MIDLTKSNQDYLKQIYDLGADGLPVSTTDLALRLGVAPSSVTGMLQRLATAEPALVQYHKHQGATLTREGERAALDVIRHHRLLEAWLVRTLGYTWDEVHEEAERLEHVISDEMVARIAAALGHPARDPHGDPIPSAELAMPEDQLTPLSALRAPQKGIIRRVHSKDAAFLRHLDNLGLVPGKQLEVTAYSNYDTNLTIKSDLKTTIIGEAITSRIFIQIL